MTDQKSRIAELYFASGSMKFGEFTLSAHQLDPTLPLSPYYLHYPLAGEPGSEFLPEMFSLIGDEFHALCEAHGVRPDKVAGVPNGAVPIAEAHAKHYDEYPKNLLTFGKLLVDGQSVFTGPEGVFADGDKLIVGEDHTSGGVNKKRIKKVATDAGLLVRVMLTVVDRQQGGVANMAKEGVTLLPVFTVDELLDAAEQGGFATSSQVERVREYKATNQITL